MKETLSKWRRNRISQTLWQQNASHVGFRWFHERGLPAPYVLDEVSVEVSEVVSKDILQLRLLAAQSDGRLLQATDPERCRDHFDQHALHVKLILRKQLVAAGRLVFLQGRKELSEINEVLVPLPDEIMSSPELVEISRVCTHPDFRRGHLLTLLLAECAWAAYERGGRSFLGFCVPALVPVYVRFAGELLPYSGKHPLYEGRESCVVRINLEKVIRGEDIPFLAWARFVAPRVQEASDPAVQDWVLRMKTQGVRLVRPCVNQALKLMLPQSA